MLVRDAKFARGVAVHDVRGTHSLKLFRQAFAPYVAARRLELKRVARHSGVVPAKNNVNWAKFQLHTRVRVEVFAGAAHRSQPPWFAAAHGDLKYGAARRVEIVQLFL